MRLYSADFGGRRMQLQFASRFLPEVATLLAKTPGSTGSATAASTGRPREPVAR